jgi:hypothetical protein
LWVLSALVGRARFDEDERAAFWDCVTEVAVSSSGPTRQLLESMAAERRWIFEEFEREARPPVSGLHAVSSILDDKDRAGGASGGDVRRAILRIGWLFARARGPFGRTVTLEDEQKLLLVEQLMRTSDETRSDNPLNSTLPI